MAIAEALRNISLDTILGSFSFDENGDAIYEPFVHIVKDGKLVPFDASEIPADDITGDNMADADDGMTDAGMSGDDTSSNDGAAAN